ncbi:MAG: DoxX family protein [Rhodanobacter sp.]
MEVGLGLALLVGYRTRLAAALMVAFTVVTALTFHAHFADPNRMTHFLKNIAISGGLLHVAAHDAGGFALDALRLRHAYAN